MCDRYSFALSKEKIARRFQVKVPQVPAINYNISPGNPVPVIINQTNRQLGFYRWGLEPETTPKKKAIRLIHAIASSTVLKRPVFYNLLQTQRCLILADGFYLWRRISRKSQVPYRIVLKWNLPFAFAGIWNTYQSTDEAIPPQFACSLFSTSANDLLSSLYPTMPVILPMEAENEWLNPACATADLIDMLKMYSADKMNYFPVTTQINNPDFNSPALLQAVQATDQFGNYILFNS